MFSLTAAADETKFREARLSDEFELLEGSKPLFLLRDTLSLQGETQVVFRRSDLVVAGISVHHACIARQLRPLTQSAPEQFGKTVDEVLVESLPVSKDASIFFKALFHFLSKPADFPARHFCIAQNSEYAKVAFEKYRSAVVPAALQTIFERALERFKNSDDQDSQNLAKKFLFEVKPERFAGKGSGSALPVIIEQLQRQDKDGKPLWVGSLAMHLLRIVSLNRPISPDLRLPFFKILRRYQRPDMSAAEIDFAETAEFTIFH